MKWNSALAPLVLMNSGAALAAPNSDIKIVMECPLTGVDGRQHKIVLGFGQEYISQVDANTTKILDPDQILAGVPIASIKIDEGMQAGSKYAVTFGSDHDAMFRLLLLTIETGAFDAKLTDERNGNGPSYSGRCFMIDGPVASYIFKRRQSGVWDTK